MFARLNLAARPHIALVDGRAHRIEGDLARARRSWAKARAIATKLDMPYEHALADLEIAASYPAGSPERSDAARQALAQLEPHAAHFDAARARALIGGPPATTPATRTKASAPNQPQPQRDDDPAERRT